MTAVGWAHVWFWWLLFVLLSWLAMELDSIRDAHRRGETFVMDYTLSETIRRWSVKERWLAPVAIGTSCFLLAHFFLEKNPG